MEPKPEYKVANHMIRISEDVYEALLEHFYKPGDTWNSVVRRALGLPITKEPPRTRNRSTDDA